MTEILTRTTADQLHISADTIDRITELAHASVAIQTYAGTDHLIVPDGYKHIDITDVVERAQQAPNRKKGTAHLSDIDSFIQYVKDQNMSHLGYIYADPEACTLTAVFNDYRESASTGWRDHRAVFKAEKSREFLIWLNSNKEPKEQEAFAVFLEDNIADIAEPSGETLLSIALTLQAKTDVNFSSSRRLDNGQVQLAYTENIDARAGNGNIDIPREFSIGVRLFKNGSGYKLRARLKYRLGGGKVKFWYELDRADNAIEDAFKDYITKAADSGYTVLLGKP
ncbi:DUF2303 family protein [Undibacterium sp. 5I1]|uniref:DUF2303 family protein n=1 Tax=Undibacterium sp. 5I1 TaxID=3048590 RepID=UPI002AB5A7A5|nr:DUF2303 family protein [Undibacterium sp. 5I1]MDY7537653.1 DUF2303 family protein [Undibacterium sp. 5I1]MEB0256390.1 DUF2303 family protein [Undibacterium sp. 5I1]